ncbi:MAG: glycosyltransferase family 2 protein [Acidobacteriia bacterium]|nr:glycosyltransferase family 2 protein [Terriglobia bacterium]
MTITAIVPVWNGRDLLLRLLQSLEAQTQPVAEWLIVDNGSTDGAPELARDCGARVIRMGRNMGFAAAVNRGIQASLTEWIAVLNSDVELAPDYLAQLCAAGAPFATGKILMATDPEYIDATFDVVSGGAVPWRVGNGRRDGPLFQSRREIWSAPWTAVLLRREVIERVGMLNEAFESYLEDVEFGLRCAAAQISGIYVPEAVAWHRGSAALGRWHPETVRLMARNQCYLAALHYSRRYAWPILVGQALWGLLAARRGAGLAWARGKLEGIRNAWRLKGQSSRALDALIRENECLIYGVQSATEFDLYWRLYFLLTRGRLA